MCEYYCLYKSPYFGPSSIRIASSSINLNAIHLPIWLSNRRCSTHSYITDLSDIWTDKHWWKQRIEVTSGGKSKIQTSRVLCCVLDWINGLKISYVVFRRMGCSVDCPTDSPTYLTCQIRRTVRQIMLIYLLVKCHLQTRLTFISGLLSFQ